MSGIETRDDAGFIPFGGGLLLQTADFFTPIVDDPYRFGQIAAANAFSDVYAMGGEPLTAMNLVAFPCSLDLGILREILAGGLSKIEESGARLCGGHSVQDEEPKYGLSVTGFVEADRVVRNAGAEPGDALVLTKPLGLGILTTALKLDIVSEEEIEDAVQTASLLNKAARDAIREVGVSAATDVTGYGFLGHLTEMLEAGGVGAVVHRDEIPVWERSRAAGERRRLSWRTGEQQGVPGGPCDGGRRRTRTTCSRSTTRRRAEVYSSPCQRQGPPLWSEHSRNVA